MEGARAVRELVGKEATLVVWVGVRPDPDELVPAERPLEGVEDPDCRLARWFLERHPELRGHPTFGQGVVWDAWFYYPAGKDQPSAWGAPVLHTLPALKAVLEQFSNRIPAGILF